MRGLSTNWHRTPSRLNCAIMSGLLLLTACTKHKNSNTTSADAGLALSGHLLAPDGSAAAGARVYLPGSADPVATSDASGAFALNVSAAQVNAIQLLRPNNAGSSFLTDFQLYFEAGDGSSLVEGGSGYIKGTDSGAKDLGTIALTKPVTINGIVKLMGETGDAQRAPNITIAFDRADTKSDKDGTFALKGVPSGVIRLYAYRDDTAISTVQVNVPAGNDLNLDFPLLVYGKNAVNGSLMAEPQVSTLSPLLPGLPDQRSFRVIRSGNAHFIRYSDDQSKLSAAAWQEIPARLSYNFPQNGANVLYYQFADGTQSSFSEIHSATVAAYPFADSSGIVIEDGSGVIATRRVSVHIDVPSVATEMRLSETNADLGTLSTLPFVKAANTFTYTFAIQAVPGGKDNNQEETELRTLYCQFKAADGTISPTYQAAVKLTPFSADLTSKGVFTIGDGSGTNRGWQVPIKVAAPAGAAEMRLWEEDKVTVTTSGDAVLVVGERMQPVNIFFPVAANVTFTFQNTGFKTLYLQFRTADGLTSTVFTQPVLVTTLAKVDSGFTINGGAALSTSRIVTIDFTPPANAPAYRISEDPVTIMSVVQSYIPTSKKLLYTTTGVGLRTIYIQYLDGAANPGTLWNAQILVDPFNNDTGKIWLDGYDDNALPIVSKPTVRIDIVPPQAAVPDGQMEVIRANMSLQGTPVCAPLQITNSFVAISDHFNFELTVPGASAICVRFKNVEGDVGPYLMQNVMYDPWYGGFPPNSVIVAVEEQAENGTVNTRAITVDVLLPQAARQFRIAPSSIALATAPWQIVSAVMNPMVMQTYLAKPGPAGDDHYYEVSVQFMDEPGNVSPVYSNKVVLLFPPEDLKVALSVALREAASTSLSVDLTPAPQGARWIKIAQKDEDIEAATAQPIPVSQKVTYKVDAITGIVNLSFQYIAEDGTKSIIFHQGIDVTP